MKSADIQWPKVYLAVGLTTLATLLLELSLTRIFSVVFYYHFAFLAISIALFGMGVGGVFSYVVAGWKSPLFSKLGHLSALNSLAVVFALVMILAQKSMDFNLSLGLLYFVVALPFLFSGAIVSLAISETISRVSRVYFFDLLGAAGGCLLLIPLLNMFGGLSTVLAAAVIFAAVSVLWYSMAGSVPSRVGGVALMLAMVALFSYNQVHHISYLDIRYAKGKLVPDEVFAKWNTFSRIAVVKHEKPIPGYYIAIDADATTNIANFDFDHLTAGERGDLTGQGLHSAGEPGGPALPYTLRPGAKSLIIGPGGGWDVSRALASGSHDVTAVEINPLIATTVMRERFPNLSRNLYLRPDVHVHIEDGRSFVRRSIDRYQVVQATLVDTFAATAAGAFALSENNLYTSDAFRDYLLHLTDDGLIAFTRWGFTPPRESLRLVSLAIEALGQLGETEPWRHVIVGRDRWIQNWGAQDTVLVSRKPFVQTDIERARAAMAAGGLEPVYLPGLNVRNEFRDLLLSPDAGSFQRAYRFDISPVSDNRPFFFYTVQPRDMLSFLRSTTHNSDYNNNKAVPLLFGLMAVSLVATLLILVLPPLVLGTRLPAQKGVRGFLLYFLFIGAGYILIEVGLIQKFVLFLGHPTYALTVVIFSLLVSSGIGSAMSRRAIAGQDGRLMKVLGCVAVLTAALAVMVSWLLSALVGLPLQVKISITVALIAPLGFLMGMPFPTALRRLEDLHSPSVRWAWSLNAASSVLGSVGALVSAIYLGLMQTVVLGGLFYLAAVVVMARVRIKVPARATEAVGRVAFAD